jgi:hypothetical protein
MANATSVPVAALLTDQGASYIPFVRFAFILSQFSETDKRGDGFSAAVAADEADARGRIVATRAVRK